MKLKIKVLFFILLILGSCEKGYITDCDECNSENIGDVNLEIWVSESTSYAVEVVKIYEGLIEDGNLLAEFPAYDSYSVFPAMLYKDYTLSVEYKIEGKKYIVIDSVRPKVRYDKNSCDEACYYVYDNIADLRLKYTK